MNDYRVIAITHKQFPLETIGHFHVAPEERAEVLKQLRAEFGMEEVMLLSTCNRVELVFTLPHYVCPGLTTRILQAMRPQLDENVVKEVALKADRHNGTEALEHLLRVASSLESLVIGEREIITQLRNAYEVCEAEGLTGDDLRILIKQCVKTAKEIFTHTDLSRKPVSVVSLAWQQFREKGIREEQRILLVGAGQIIRNFYKFLSENGYRNVTIANRSLGAAQELVDSFGGTAIALADLPTYSGGFDALVTCTAADHAIIGTDLYRSLLAGETSEKLVIDLSLPADLDAEVLASFPLAYVGMAQIQQQASANIQFREQALSECEPIIENGLAEFERLYNERRVERAMRSIPEAIKEIRATALGSVFARDLEQLDDNSREVLEKILHYMEKKYISVPMKMAREVLLDAVAKN